MRDRQRKLAQAVIMRLASLLHSSNISFSPFECLWNSLDRVGPVIWRNSESPRREIRAERLTAAEEDSDLSQCTVSASTKKDLFHILHIKEGPDSFLFLL